MHWAYEHHSLLSEQIPFLTGTNDLLPGLSEYRTVGKQMTQRAPPPPPAGCRPEEIKWYQVYASSSFLPVSREYENILIVNTRIFVPVKTC